MTEYYTDLVMTMFIILPFCSNLKMYYYTTGNIPPISWLDSNTHTILNTREKLEETLDADTKAKLYADA